MPSLAERTEERRRAVALARHLRESERLSKARFRGSCRQCGAPTQARSRKGDAYEYCKKCDPGAIAGRWTRDQVIAAMRAWRDRYGRLPSSYDWSRTHATRRGGEAAGRLAEGDWPAPGTVSDLFGTWAAARAEVDR